MHDRKDAAVKYCMFCREAFEDEMRTCPYCEGELMTELPDEGEAEEKVSEPEDPMQGKLVPVVIVGNEEDLRAASGVLAEFGISFEIDDADVLRKTFPVFMGKPAWRILVQPDEGPDAFLKLAKALPQLFPPEVREALEREREEHPDEARLAALRIQDAAKGPVQEMMTSTLAKDVITVFAGEDENGIAVAQGALARRGREVAGLLSEIAVQSVAEGGEGAERVLYNALEVLEALGYSKTLDRIEPLLESQTPQVRARAAYATGRLGEPSAVDSLLALLSDADEEVRYEASEAVWRLTGMDFEFDPYRKIDDEHEHVEAIRRQWEASDKKGRVRNKADLATLLAALADAGD